MATSQTTPDPRRRPRGDRGTRNSAAKPERDPTDTPTGQPNARGTSPLARHPSTTTNRATTPDVSAADREITHARLAAMSAPRLPRQRRTTDDQPDIDTNTQQTADNSGTLTVIVQPRDFRLPDVLRHIEAGKIVLIIPQDNDLTSERQ